MKFKPIAVLLIVLLTCACHQQNSRSGLQVEDSPDTQLQSRTGLKIEYKPTRGQSYRDIQGNSYQLRHIPAMITNDSTIPIHVQIAFSQDYNYPKAYNDEQFRVFPMPKGWAMDGVDITDRMLDELQVFIDRPGIDKTLDPGETWFLAFGTLYPRPINYGVFPVAVFSHDSRALHHECDRLINPDSLPIQHRALELLLGFTSASQASPDRCLAVTCGHISYPDP